MPPSPNLELQEHHRTSVGMKFTTQRRRNPFDNPVVGLALHAAVASGLLWACYVALTVGSLIPLWVALGVLTLLEGTWLYFLLRR